MNSKRNFLLSALGVAAAIPAIAARPQSKEYLPNVVLQTHLGEGVRFYDDLVKGNKVVVFNMIYTACQNICPPNTANLIQVQKMLGSRMGRDIFFFSITLQPEVDKARDLQEYARRYGIAPGWTLLTGRRKEIDIVRKTLGFVDPDPAVDESLERHTGMLRIGNAGIDRWSMVPSLLKPQQIVKSITSMKKRVS
ncbi:SCO family protein [Massilia sp. CMS3.1]|uniref:SCO family protein n=1 Tax=Massilia sp. CMS3.1 TaxID=3373083 RepID=UPI003EE58A2B